MRVAANRVLLDAAAHRVRLHEVFFEQQDAVVFEFRLELLVRFLRHRDQDVGRGQVRVEDFGFGDDELGRAGAAARLRAEALGERGVLVVVERRGLAEDHADADDALAAETGYLDVHRTCHSGFIGPTYGHELAP